ncbi:hypothetical protein D3C81_1883130 [compost metagenome]
MHQPRTKHQDDLANDKGMERAGILGFQVHVVQAWGGVAIGIGHQLHQQHAVLEVVGLRYPHTRTGQAE